MTAIAVVLLFLAPAAGAKTLVSFTAPYTGTVKLLSSSTYAAGCQASASLPVAPSVSRHAGEIAGSVVASAAWCSGFSYAAASASMGFQGPNFTLNHSGTHVATEKWLFSYNWHIHVKATNNTSALANVYVFIYDYVFDETNFSLIFGNKSFTYIVDKSFSFGSGSVDRDAIAYTSQMTGFMKHGHLYEFYSVVYIAAYVDVFAPGSGASAALDLGSPGNGGVLVSLTVT